MIGRTLSHYEITAFLGAGGMGEVYRARDTTLSRDVALKLLPADLASDPERLARFDREARLLASLNHPGVGAIYGFEEGAQGERFLVLELVEGADLSERLARGALPVDEALRIAAQVAEALEAAHDRGIVHRDLKPGNIKVTPDGRVKVLDFGLAKAWSGDGEAAAVGELSRSPTLAHGGTAAGIILGTAAYMSPEQARGRAVDQRSDVWSLGVVLFEMLAGRRPFGGETVSEVLAAVIKDPPAWSHLPATVPPAVVEVLRLCLANEPADRLRDVADVRILLAAAAATATTSHEPTAAPTPAGWRWREGAAWLLAAVGLGAAWFGVSAERPSGVDLPPTTFTDPVPEGQTMTLLDVPALAFSADGRALAFTAVDKSGASTIYLRQLDRPGTRPVVGTEGGSGPFFSPDGLTLGFFSEGYLRTVPLAGGPVVTLAETPTHRGAVWHPDGSILFSPDFAAGLWRLRPNGGTPEPVVAPRVEDGERTYRWPELLPGGRGVLYTVGDIASPNDFSGARIVAYSLEDGRGRLAVENAQMARFLPPDVLLFARDGDLYAVGFDPERMDTTGSPRRVEEGVAGDIASGASHFAAARDGTLALVRGASARADRLVTLVDRQGVATTLPLSPRSYRHPRFSPDGSRLAFSVEGDSGAATEDEVWVYAFSDGKLSRLTFEGRWIPVWSPDGEQVLYQDPRSMALLARAADGSGSEEVVAPSTGRPPIPGGWSPDGRRLALTLLGGPSNDVYTLGPGQDPAFFQADAGSPSFSPNGRWIAYQSPSVGDARVFVREVDGPGKWQISPERGSYPRWSADGRELYFIGGVLPLRSLMVVPIAGGDRFSAGPPRVLLPDLTRYLTATAPHVDWDVAPGGERFAFVELEGSESEGTQIEVILRWGRSVSPALAGGETP